MAVFQIYPLKLYQWCSSKSAEKHQRYQKYGWRKNVYRIFLKWFEVTWTMATVTNPMKIGIPVIEKKKKIHWIICITIYFLWEAKFSQLVYLLIQKLHWCKMCIHWLLQVVEAPSIRLQSTTNLRYELMEIKWQLL